MSDEEQVARSRLERAVRSDDSWDSIHLGVGMAPVPGKIDLTLEVDADVLAWFTTRETDIDAAVNRVLRSYVEAQRGMPES